MICTNCKNEIADDKKFCPLCGHKLVVTQTILNNGGASAPYTQQSSPQNTGYYNPGPAPGFNPAPMPNPMPGPVPKKSNAGIVIACSLGGALLLILIVAAIAVSIVRSKGSAMGNGGSVFSGRDASNGEGNDSETVNVTVVEDCFQKFIDGRDFVKEGTYKGYVTGGSDGWGIEPVLDEIPYGCINYAVRDFDSDGMAELLVVGTDERKNLYLQMYENLNNEAILADEYVYSEGNNAYLTSLEGKLRVSIFDDTRFIINSSYQGWIYGDGMNIDYEIFEYTNGRILILAKEIFSGSDGDFDYMANGLESVGITNPIGKGYCRDTLMADDVVDDRIILAEIVTVHSQQFVDYANRYYDPSSIGTRDKIYASDVQISLSETYPTYKYEEAWSNSSGGYMGEYDDFILPDSSTRRLSVSDLYGLTKDECRIARNEIYARHGRMFTDEYLQGYFNSKSWYYPEIAASDFKESMLSDVEMYNRDLIKQYEDDNF